MSQKIKELREITGAGMLDCKKALEATDGDIKAAIDYLREKGIAKADKKAGRIAAEGLTEVIIGDDCAVVVEVNSETDFVAKNEEFKELLNVITNLIIENDVNTLEEALDLNHEEGTLKDLITAKIAKIGEKLDLRRFKKVAAESGQNIGIYKHMGGRISTLVVLDGGNSEVASDIAMHLAAMNPKYLNEQDVPADELEKEKAILKEQAMASGKPENIAEQMVNGGIKKFLKENCLEEQPFVKDSAMTVKEYAEKNNAKIVEIVRFEVGEGIEKEVADFAEEVRKQING